MKALQHTTRLLFLLLAVSVNALAADDTGSTIGESSQRGWMVSMYNDLFSFSNEDQDFTAGAAFTLGGERAKNHVLSLDGPLGWVDRILGIERYYSDGNFPGHALQTGLILFTPNDLTTSEPIQDDRPYANLIYLSSSRLSHHPSKAVAYQSTLTLGVLGLPVAEHLQSGVHRLTGGDEPNGYDHQISDGGEPTFRYAVSRYALLSSGVRGRHSYDVRFGVEASLGYLTEVNSELVFRWGRIRSAWWNTPAASADYSGQPVVGEGRSLAYKGDEIYFTAGAKIRGRLYNSLLQGQFKDSPVTYSASELNRVIAEAWIGVQAAVRKNLFISYTIRHQTKELKKGKAARSFTWASIAVQQRF